MDIVLFILVYTAGVIFNLYAYYVDERGITGGRLVWSFLSWFIVILAVMYVFIKFISENWDKPIIKRKEDR
jgi:hypothetical protein